MLVLDELGASKLTGGSGDDDPLINKRTTRKKTTIFTSNYLDMPSSSSYDGLTDR